GKISARLRRIYSAVQEAQEHACRNIQAGMSGEEIDALCRDYLRKKGLEQYFIHATGHGIGMEVHEMPSVSPRPNHPSYPLLRKGGEGKRRKRDLPEGAVITCEPGVYIPRLGGVRIEDTLILTKKGNVNLQERVSKKLISLPASNNPLSISPLEKGERKRRGV
ncbi:MAG: M24 family metallopeptidase, partial [bacterium]|nr:M24 family metallopeptidase [bacterium]